MDWCWGLFHHTRWDKKGAEASTDIAFEIRKAELVLD